MKLNITKEQKKAIAREYGKFCVNINV